jgi:hypothetical protein
MKWSQRRVGGESEDHIRLIFSKVLEVAGTLEVHLNFWIFLREASQLRYQEADAEPVGDPEPDGALRLGLLGPQVAGNRKQPLVQPQQLIG